jgi:hypothetical protein
VKNCQLAIVFIGKRYGSVSDNNLSVTHNEFGAARRNKIPTICLVDHEVLSFKKVFDCRNPEQPTPNFPSMDSPEKTFQFIQDVIDGSENNAILPYKTVTEARALLKKQLALIFGDLLSSRFDPLKAEIKDVLSEVMTLRHELGDRRASLDQRFLTAFRFLVDDENKEYRQLIERTVGPIDTALSLVLGSVTFDEFVQNAGITLEISDEPMNLKSEMTNGCNFASERVWGRQESGEDRPPTACYACWHGKRVLMNERAKQMFDWKHEKFRLAVGPQTEGAEQPAAQLPSEGAPSE